MRPRYETEQDRVNERMVADKLEKFYNAKAIKVNVHDGYDFNMLRDNKVVARVEVKCRNNTSTKYRTYIIATMKVDKLTKMQQNDGIPTVIAVQWQDRLGVLSLPASHKVIMGGRKDRGDKWDQEKMAEFEIRDFKFVA